MKTEIYITDLARTICFLRLLFLRRFPWLRFSIISKIFFYCNSRKSANYPIGTARPTDALVSLKNAYLYYRVVNAPLTKTFDVCKIINGNLIKDVTK